MPANRPINNFTLQFCYNYKVYQTKEIVKIDLKNNLISSRKEQNMSTLRLKHKLFNIHLAQSLILQRRGG